MNRKHECLLLAVLVLGWVQSGAVAESIPSSHAVARMPVREVTIFKDGHAFVLQAGLMPVDGEGNVVLDTLPTPVLGTFWPYSNEKDAALKAVIASLQKVRVERTALDLRSLIEANIGKDIIINEATSAGRYHATILGIPTRSSQEQEATNPPNSGEALPQKSNLVQLRTDDGVKMVDIGRILDVTIKGEPNSKLADEEFRSLLTMDLDWKGAPAKQADVGMFYLQKGLRWIPSYKVVIDGKGNAKIKLEASIVNDLTDLENVTAHLVIGVPRFVMEDQIDPIALQQSAQQLSQYFQAQNGANLSNSIMTQMMDGKKMVYRGAPADAAPSSSGAAPGPEVIGGGQNEDLYVFTVTNLTLKKGQRMVLPVKEVTLKYRDVYTLDVPFAPPAEVWRNFNSNQQMEIARLTAKPKVMHQLRITNGKECPLTTAPAMIFLNDNVLGQGLMTYTSKEGEVDLPITVAVDIQVKKSEKEINRTPNATSWDGDSYHKIDLSGTLSLTNYSAKDVELEIKRYVLGNVSEASQSGQIEMINLFEDPEFLSADGSGPWPYWWNWYSWPYWWHHFNGIGKISWKVKLQPGKSMDLTYAWNYYWR